MEPHMKRWMACGIAVCAVAAFPSCALRNTHENLNAALWMQTSAEYEMSTTMAYDRAEGLLEASIARAKEDPQWTAAIEQTGNLSAKPFAVVLDVDETVLDNHRFQGQLTRARAGQFDKTLWADWIQHFDAPAVKGARAFAQHATERGVKLMFVTSRTSRARPRTLMDLRGELQIAVDPDDLWMVPDKESNSDIRPTDLDGNKALRRARIGERYRILLLVGDDLGDFVPVAGMDWKARRAEAYKYAAYWSSRWVLLPNPTYGSWEHSLYEAGDHNDKQRLARKWRLLEGMDAPAKP